MWKYGETKFLLVKGGQSSASSSWAPLHTTLILKMQNNHSPQGSKRQYLVKSIKNYKESAKHRSNIAPTQDLLLVFVGIPRAFRRHLRWPAGSSLISRAVYGFTEKSCWLWKLSLQSLKTKAVKNTIKQPKHAETQRNKQESWVIDEIWNRLHSVKRGFPSTSISSIIFTLHLTLWIMLRCKALNYLSLSIPIATLYFGFNMSSLLLWCLWTKFYSGLLVC